MTNLPTLSTDDGHVIHGARLKFVDGAWTSEDRIMAGAKLLVLHQIRVLQRFHADRVEYINEDTQGLLPDHEALNGAIPMNEWRISELTGNPEAPWQLCHVIYFIDLSSFELFTAINSTFGQKIAWGKLRDQVTWCSALRRQPMLPIVELSSAKMKTKKGTKQRPFFNVTEWRSFLKDGDASVPAIAGPSPPTAPALAKAEPPSLAEEMDDEIPF
jgi:hypothetical protein